MNTNRKASSFLISDILGLDSVNKTNEINSEHFLQQYQNSLKQSYFSSLVNAASQSEFYRMISGSNFINETNKPLMRKFNKALKENNFQAVKCDESLKGQIERDYLL